jgi:hypothetical protein
MTTHNEFPTTRPTHYTEAILVSTTLVNIDEIQKLCNYLRAGGWIYKRVTTQQWQHNISGVESCANKLNYFPYRKEITHKGQRSESFVCLLVGKGCMCVGWLVVFGVHVC